MNKTASSSILPLALGIMAVLGIIALMLTHAPVQKKANEVFVHHCDWSDEGSHCNYEGDSYFLSDFEEGSDGYYYQRNHFYHPTWTPERCESYLFNDSTHMRLIQVKALQNSCTDVVMIAGITDTVRLDSVTNTELARVLLGNFRDK